MRKCAAWVLLVSLVLGLYGCSVKETAVFVQNVGDLMQMDGMGARDKYNGIVVSESVSEITKDEDKTIESISVREGDDVTEGQELFAYDTEELQLTLEKQQLELEQLQSSIENYTAQIAQLEHDRERANAKEKLEYTIQIQTNQIDLKEAALKLKTKEGEIRKTEHLLANAVVVSPVTGRVTSVGTGGTDDYGRPKAFITIQKTGSFRIKGTLNEMQRGSIMEGDRVLLESRLDPNQTWTGTISLVDYENPTQGNNNGYSMGSDEMGNSSRYPFYVELDSSEGLLLGQHLYLSILIEGGDALEGVTVSSSFLCYDENGSCYVWAENGGKLEKREVTLGDYDPMEDRYSVLEGLSEQDYLAFPDESVCVVGAPTTRQNREGGVK